MDRANPRDVARCVLVFVLSLPLGACVTNEPLPLQFEPEDFNESNEDQPVLECTVLVEKIQDIRDPDAGIGYVGTRAVQSEELAQLVERSLRSLETGPIFDPAKAPIRLSLTLHKLYVHNILGNKSANIVVTGVIFRGEKLAKERVYRGRSTSILWSGDPNEIKKAFRVAGAKLRAAIVADLTELCD